MNGNNAQKAQAVKEFLGFLSKYSPEVYAAVMTQVPEAAAAISMTPHMEGFGMFLGQAPTPQTTTTAPPQKAWWEKALEAATEIGGAYFGYQAQKDVLKIQQQRATQGLPPIPTEAYAPTIRHSVDIPPEFRQQVMGGGTLLALGLGAAVLFFALR